MVESHPVIGALSCASSSCHGGADEKSRQFVIWSQHDVHSRAYATLATARSARMAEALKIPDVMASERCTACHAPLETVPVALRPGHAHPTEGVSCASCHGPADPWLRAHTRLDFTHDDRIAAGMRELRNLYHRANACISCHQNVDPELIATGRHPALNFELDGQTQSQPKHWREAVGHDGAQTWFVGQAVALRELSAALRSGRGDAARETPRWQALLWLVQRAGLNYELPQLDGRPAPTAVTFTRAAEFSDQLAQRAAQTWAPAQNQALLARLAATHGDFLDTGVPVVVQACRADRLVLALDRLLVARPAGERPAAAAPCLDELFRLAQSQPDFVPAKFARALAAFAQTLGG